MSLEGKPRQECLLGLTGRLSNNLERSELNPSLGVEVLLHNPEIQLQFTLLPGKIPQGREEERALNDLPQ